MSDTSNLANNNIEPSMEDILSSIRQVIAEDLSQQEEEESQSTAENVPQIETAIPEDITVDTVTQAEGDDVQIAKQQVSAEDHLDDILELDNLLGDINDPTGALDEAMELIQLEDEPKDTPTPEHDVQDLDFESLIVPAPETIDSEPVAENIDTQITATDFDETLDLVMDADASDYITETYTHSDTEPQKEPDTEPQEEQIQAAETPIADDAQIESILDDILLSPPTDFDDDAPLDETTQEPEHIHEPVQTSAHDDMDLVKSLLEDLMDEPIAETVSVSVETVISEANSEVTNSLDIEGSFGVEDSFSEDDLLIPDPETAQVENVSEEADLSEDADLTETSDLSKDLDLSKDQDQSEVTEAFTQTSLLPDTQDFEGDYTRGSEANFAETSEEVSVAEDGEDDFETMAVEPLIVPNTEAETEPDTEVATEPETELETELETEPDNTFENELAQLVREISEVRDTPTENISADDDVIELSTPDYVSKLAISASLIGGATETKTEEEPQGIIAAAAENDLASLQQLIAETALEDSDPEKPEMQEETLEKTQEEEIEITTSPTQEEDAMATPLKNDALSDADTQQEVSNAFASLSTTVQEHALAEENGPPIGELVKEALRPMLQEWLDKNLKAMVQRAVTKEIKRISSGK